MNRKDVEDLIAKMQRIYNPSGDPDVHVPVNLHGEDLSGADLSGLDLSGANLHEANLSGANLKGTNLNRANLHGVDLTKASTDKKTTLKEANLHAVDMTGIKGKPDFTDANLHLAKGKP